MKDALLLIYSRGYLFYIHDIIIKRMVENEKRDTEKRGRE